MTLLTRETRDAVRRGSLKEQPRFWLALSGLLLIVLAMYLWGPAGVLRVPVAVYPQLAPLECEHDALLLISAGILRETASTMSLQAPDRDSMVSDAGIASVTLWNREPAMEGWESAFGRHT